jgi:Ca2+-binding RTX toxin-like protein
VVDATTNQPVTPATIPYTGPVSGLTQQFIQVTADNLNIAAETPGWFIHTGSGNDAIAVTSGTNVLDGGTGSNFLTGGSGTDTFFVDDRTATATTWSTVNNFHAGDSLTLWGVDQKDFTLSWLNSAGAAGYTGLTLSATAAGKPEAIVTLAGFTQAALSNGTLSVNYGTDAASGSVYTMIHANAAVA